VFGNAGGPPGTATVGSLVCRARVLEVDGRVVWRTREQLGLRYRGSALDGCLVLSVDLALKTDRTERLRRIRQEAAQRKSDTQPLEARSAGCTFRNPAGESAGRMIDDLGLKGLRVGGAVVSTVHGNFIVNQGGASAKEILSLMDQVRQRVFEARGICLEPELRLIA
jgi:UDP-N-acetylmuramate dehydrogenase